MSQTNHVQHDRQVVTIDNANVEQCRAIIVACEARIEMLKKDTHRQLRENLKVMAQAQGTDLQTLLKGLLAGEEHTAEMYRSRRPAGAAAAERAAAAKRMKFYEPVSQTGWSGMGRAPHVFRDPDTGQVDRRLLESCRNPQYEGEWKREDDAAQ